MESFWAIVEPHSVSIIIGILMNAMMFIHTSMNALCPMPKSPIRVLYHHPNNSLSSIYHPQPRQLEQIIMCKHRPHTIAMLPQLAAV